MGLFSYLIFTGICLIIPSIGWAFWLGGTLIIIAINIKTK